MPKSPDSRRAFGLPAAFVAGAVGLAAAAMLAVLALGFGRYGLLVKGLWTPTLGGEALLLLGLAALVAVVCVWILPERLRGWPALVAFAILWTAAACGAGATLAVGGVIATSLVAGHALLTLGGGQERVDPALGLASGLGAVMLAIVGAALVHLPSAPFFWVLQICALLAVALSARIRRSIGAAFEAARDAGAAWDLPRTICAWLILFAWMFYAANAALPERFWDALVQHLLIPTQVLMLGHWIYDPAQYAFTFFPAGGDNMFAFAMAEGGEAAVNILNMAVLGAILLLLRNIVRSFTTTGWAELSLLLLLGLPMALLSSTTAMVENLLALFALASLQALLKLDARPPRQAMLALAVLLPAMCAMKLHGVILAAPCGGIVLLHLRGQRFARADLLRIGVAATGFGALGLGQYAYAFYRTGNPVFPFMNQIFRSPLWPPVAFTDARWTGHLSWDVLYQMTFHSSRFVEAYDGALGFVLLALLLPGVVATLLAPRRAAVMALALGGFYCAILLLQIQYIRYLYPVMPLLLVVCVHGLTAVRGKWGRRAAAAYASSLAVLGLLLLPSAA